MDLSKILAASGVSNEVVKDAGAIKSDDKPAKSPKTTAPKMYPQGINHAKRLFYAIYIDDVASCCEFPVCGIETFEAAKTRRDDYRAVGLNARVVSVIEVDYTESN